MDLVADTGTREGEDAAIEAAKAAGSAWLARSSISLNGPRASFSFAILDVARGALVSSENFSAFAGPTILALVDGAVARVVARLTSYRKESRDGTPRPLSSSVTFRSPDEGAVITLSAGAGITLSPEAARHGSQEPSRLSGVVRDGELVFSELPLLADSQVDVSVSKFGKRTARMTVTLAEGKPVELPALADEPILAFHAGSASGRVIGLGLGVEARFAEGWLFIPLDLYGYVSPSLTRGGSPIVHLEVWQGFGAYFFFPPGSFIRTGLEARAGLIMSWLTSSGLSGRFFIDPAIIPVTVFAEVGLSRSLAARIGVCGIFALGTGTGNLFYPGWMNSGLPTLELALEWRP
jgi:hypothetical protein